MRDFLFDFFRDNILYIYLFYALLFYLMGTAITFRNRQNSKFRLASSLKYLAIFSYTHGTVELVKAIEIFNRGEYLYVANSSWEFVKVGLGVMSFSFLLCFGVSYYFQNHNKWSRRLPWILLWIWLGVAFVFVFFIDSDWYFRYILNWSRYLFAAPGSGLAVIAFLREAQEESFLRAKQVSRSLKGAAFCFGCFFLLTGIIGSSTPYFPANYFGSKMFFSLFGVPVQLVRMVTVALTTFFVLRIMRVFSIEQDIRASEVEKQTVLLQERERIGRELHDGITQEIYATGLDLQKAHILLKKNPEQVDELMKKMSKDLNTVIKNMRTYISDLQPEALYQKNLKTGLYAMVQDFNKKFFARCFIDVDEGVGESLKTSQLANIFRIVQESLNNIYKHSFAKNIWIKARDYEDRIEITIKDDGVGFNMEEVEERMELGINHGMRNMWERALLLGSKLDIKSSLGRGADIALTIYLNDITNATTRESQGRSGSK